MGGRTLTMLLQCFVININTKNSFAKQKAVLTIWGKQYYLCIHMKQRNTLFQNCFLFVFILFAYMLNMPDIYRKRKSMIWLEAKR